MNFYGPVIDISHPWMHVQLLSCVRLFATLWTAARQAPLSMGFFKQEHWRGLPFPPTGGLPDSGSESSVFCASSIASGFFTVEPSGKPISHVYYVQEKKKKKAANACWLKHHCLPAVDAKVRMSREGMEASWCQLRDTAVTIFPQGDDAKGEC